MKSRAHGAPNGRFVEQFVAELFDDSQAVGDTPRARRSEGTLALKVLLIDWLLASRMPPHYQSQHVGRPFHPLGARSCYACADSSRWARTCGRRAPRL